MDELNSMEEVTDCPTDEGKSNKLESSTSKNDESLVGLIEVDGAQYAGQHCIADFWGGSHLRDAARIEAAMHEAAKAANAKVLNSMLHNFPGEGVTGVVMLAESHISIHTWPELDYAAFDIFMCGSAKIEQALEALKTSFSPERVEVKTLLRGKVQT